MIYIDHCVTLGYFFSFVKGVVNMACFQLMYVRLGILFKDMIMYGRPYQSKMVWVHDWWSRNRSLWLSLSIGNRKCWSLWLRLSIGDWKCWSLWLRLSIDDWKCWSLWLRSIYQLLIENNGHSGPENDWISRLMIAMVEKKIGVWKWSSRDWRSRMSTVMIKQSTCSWEMARPGNKSGIVHVFQHEEVS